MKIRQNLNQFERSEPPEKVARQPAGGLGQIRATGQRSRPQTTKINTLATGIIQR